MTRHNGSSCSLANQAYAWLLERIQNGTLHPGYLLNRRTVADALGVSVAPVLEAVVKLENEGLLETLPRKGTQVTLVTPARVRDQWILRLALECQAARMYCGAPLCRQLQPLRALARKLDKIMSETRARYAAEIAFHAKLVDLAESPLLSEEFQRVMRLELFIATHRMLKPGPPIVNQHQQLLEKLRTAKAGAAERVMRAHLMLAMRRFL